MQENMRVHVQRTGSRKSVVPCENNKLIRDGLEILSDLSPAHVSPPQIDTTHDQDRSDHDPRHDARRDVLAARGMRRPALSGTALADGGHDRVAKVDEDRLARAELHALRQ